MAGDAGKTGAEQSTEKSSIGFSLPFAERAPANPMDVMAAATAAGMALTTQFANAFFGMMQAAMDATAKPAQSASPVAPKAPAQPAAPVVQVAETVKAEVKPVVLQNRWQRQNRQWLQSRWRRWQNQSPRQKRLRHLRTSRR